MIDMNALVMPPWIVYPQFAMGNAEWQTGCCEAYMQHFTAYYQSLDRDAQAEYTRLFPEPVVWRGFLTGDAPCVRYERGMLSFPLYREGGKAKYTVGSLCDRFNAGEQMTFIPFWGHTPDANGRISKRCLSQWWLDSFPVDGVVYNCMEQYMMAGKARLFGDEETLALIMAAEKQAEIKALGRKVRNFDSAAWDEAKHGLIVSGNYHKFTQNPPLRNYLLSTGDSVLVEASPYDGIWGVRLPIDSPDISDPNKWKGENLLGFALMEVRDEIRRVFAHAAGV